MQALWPADNGGAGCYGCHSGPMLNQQPDDPDVVGVGRFVEENFYTSGWRTIRCSR